MKFSEWLDYIKRVGGVDTDGYYGKQCMDLYNHYVNNVIGVKDVGAAYAKDVIYNANVKKNFKIVKNYGDYIPPRGAIAVWQGWEYGHVSIVLSAKLMEFTSLDQNWDGVGDAREVVHNYTSGGPLYFLEPKDRSNIDEEYEVPFLVKVKVDALNIRKGPGLNYPIGTDIIHCIRDRGIYTIVEKQGNWGKLKSGAGWICLTYTERV